MKMKKIRMYHYTKAENLDKILSSGLIRLTAVSDANDPFEGSIKHPTVEDEIENELKTMCGKEVWNNYLKEEPPLIISLSAKMSSPAIWGHYADSHKGVCLVFEIPVYFCEDGDEVDEEQRKLARAIFPLEYNDSKPCIEDLVPDNDVVRKYQRLLRDSYIRKGKEWEYENEVRIQVANGLATRELHNDIVWLGGWPYYNGLMGYLHSVILGVRCEKRTSWVESRLRELHYSKAFVARAKVSPAQYKIIAKYSKDENTEEEYKDACSSVNKIRRTYSNSTRNDNDRLWFMLPRKAQLLTENTSE